MTKPPRIAYLLAATGLVSAQTATIDFTSKKQVIDGFGASSAWHGVLNTKELDAAFSNSTQNQLGLSILRVDLDPAGESSWGAQKTNATNAKARGVKYVLATPWSPPASMKDNGNTTDGSLKAGSYAAYANYLKSYRTYMGSLVDVISIQNEPDIDVDYTSCVWSANQLLNFAKNNAGTIGGSVMASESWHFDLGFTDPILADATASANISHIGLHLYSATMKTDTKAVAAGKKIWMTEHYYNADDIGTGMTLAKEIMDCLNNQMNAYIWWYLRMPDCNIINSDGSIKLKGYVMGQFSKYVRPGAYRVAATYSPQTKVTVLAFTGETNVIVALNQNTSSTSQTFKISGGTFDSAKTYVTSSSRKLAAGTTIKASGGSFTATLDAQSVTTFVGLAAAMGGNSAPVFTSAKSLSIPENTAAVVQCKATDSDGDAVEYAIAGGEDSARFAVDRTTGQLSFKALPDYENPGDAGADNVYKVIVSASDGKASTTQSIAILVTDVANESVSIESRSTALVRARVRVVDTRGVVLADEEQWLDPRTLRPRFDAGFRGMCVAWIEVDGQAPRRFVLPGIAR